MILTTKKTIKTSQILPKINNNRCLISTIQLINNNQIILVGMHISPHYQQKKDEIKNLLELLQNLQERYQESFILVYADLNIDKSQKQLVKLQQ